MTIPAPGGTATRWRRLVLVAAIVWRNLPFRIDRFTVAPRGLVDARRTYPRPLLESRFGPRPAGLDRSPSELARRAIVIAAVVALLVLVAVVLIVVLVVRAVRRRPSPQPAGAWPQGQPPWGQPGTGQPPWGQPGYGRPPEQGWAQPRPGPPAGRPEDRPAGAPEPGAPEPPSRGPGGTRLLEPDPPRRDDDRDQGPTPPS
jgi:hypothetical protein